MTDKNPTAADKNVALLRNEVVESQRVRFDILKWKLLLVAGLGAVGLGLSTKDGPKEPLVLCLLPFVCLYADIICYHNDLRILVSARFLREKTQGFWHEYEAHCLSHRQAFSMESAALFWSTAATSVLVSCFGVQIAKEPNRIETVFEPSFVANVLFLMGILGFVVGLFLQWNHGRKFRDLEQTTPTRSKVALLCLAGLSLLPLLAGTGLDCWLHPTPQTSCLTSNAFPVLPWGIALPVAVLVLAIAGADRRPPDTPPSA